MAARTGFVVLVAATAVMTAPHAAADNSRLNHGVVANVYTVQQQAGCSTDIRVNPALTLAAQWHARDLIGDHSLDGDLGSDGSTPQSRSAAAGFTGVVAETIAINPALAINNVDVINQWYPDPAAFAIMSDCRTENSLNRSVVVAVYGRPA